MELCLITSHLDCNFLGQHSSFEFVRIPETPPELSLHHQPSSQEIVIIDKSPEKPSPSTSSKQSLHQPESEECHQIVLGGLSTGVVEREKEKEEEKPSTSMGKYKNSF